MYERRRLPRSEVCKRAKIALKDQITLLECTVRNLTSDGACVELEENAHSFGSFALSFDNFRSERDCYLVWKSGDRLGVYFQ
jgi:hypothetical protein